MTWQRALDILLEEHTRAEIGELLGCTLAAVKMWRGFAAQRPWGWPPDERRRAQLVALGSERLASRRRRAKKKGRPKK